MSLKCRTTLVPLVVSCWSRSPLISFVSSLVCEQYVVCVFFSSLAAVIPSGVFILLWTIPPPVMSASALEVEMDGLHLQLCVCCVVCV